MGVVLVAPGQRWCFGCWCAIIGGVNGGVCYRLTPAIVCVDLKRLGHTGDVGGISCFVRKNVEIGAVQLARDQPCMCNVIVCLALLQE